MIGARSPAYTDTEPGAGATQLSRGPFKGSKRMLTRIALSWLFVSAVLLAGGATTQFRSASNWPFLQDQQQRARKFDEYENIRLNDEKARLDVFGSELQNDPSAKGYIIGYGGRVCRPNEAIARARRAAKYLQYSRRIGAERITTINGGYREVVGAELWIVPLGANEPPASPKLSRCSKPGASQKKGSNRRTH